MKVTTITATGTKGSTTVNDALFAAEPNLVLLSQAVRVYLSNQRQGTSKVKTRSEIARTKTKWFKQKGTGNARHGARTPNIFVGGGVSHGPNGSQNWALKLPVRTKRQALIQALSHQAANVVIADDILKLSGKTAEAATLIGQLATPKQRVLVILPSYQEKALFALRNIAQVLVITAPRVSVLEVSVADVIVVTSATIKVLEERLLSASSEAESAENYDPSAAQLVGGPVATKAPAKKRVAVKPAAKPAAKVAKPVKAEAKTAAKSTKKTSTSAKKTK